MRRPSIAIVSLAAFGLCAASARADDPGAPAAPSGAPAAAAQKGSSTVGSAASKNEMSTHEKNTGKQRKMSNPHKTAK